MIGARPLRDDEIKAILSHGFEGQFQLRNKALFALGISTGFRTSELLALSVGDVIHRKYVREFVKVRKKDVKGKTQGRTMKVQPFAQKALQNYINTRTEPDQDFGEWSKEPLFISREKDTRTRKQKRLTVAQVYNILMKAFDLAGVFDSVSTHSMRKTFAQKAYKDATERFKAGTIMMEPLRVVQKQLGHKTIQSTLSYLSFIGSEIDPNLFDFD